MRKEKVKFDLSSSPLLRLALFSYFTIITAINIILNCQIAHVNCKYSVPSADEIFLLFFACGHDESINLKKKIDNWRRELSHAEN